MEKLFVRKKIFSKKTNQIWTNQNDNHRINMDKSFQWIVMIIEINEIR